MNDAYTEQMEQWIAEGDCQEITVMLDEDFLDWYFEASEGCEDADKEFKEAKAAVEKASDEMYPGCKVVWLPESQMGEYAASHPYCIKAPRKVYEAVCDFNDVGEDDDDDASDKMERYWNVDGDELVFHENPYSEWHDTLDFEVVAWHTKQFTLQQVADALDNEQRGTGDDDEEWIVCRFTVFRLSPEGQQRICDIVQTTSAYAISDEERPVYAANKVTRRLQKHGCSHSCKLHIESRRHD